MVMAGHDWKVMEYPIFTEIDGASQHIDAVKALYKDNGEFISVVNKTYGVIQNDIPYELIEAVASEGVKWHCGISLEGGKCVVVGYLEEPIKVKGDNSETLPFITALWAHDGTAALQLIRTAIRVVCANTRAMALSESARSGREISIRHTLGWRNYVERAKEVLFATRIEFAEYRELAEELGKVKMSQEQIATFLSQFLPMPDLSRCQYSNRVEQHILDARSQVWDILAGPNTADAHRRTAYGVWQAGLEYLQHHRDTRKAYSKMNRSILREEKVATNLHKLVLSVA